MAENKGKKMYRDLIIAKKRKELFSSIKEKVANKIDANAIMDIVNSVDVTKEYKIKVFSDCNAFAAEAVIDLSATEEKDAKILLGDIQYGILGRNREDDSSIPNFDILQICAFLKTFKYETEGFREGIIKEYSIIIYIPDTKYKTEDWLNKHF